MEVRPATAADVPAILPMVVAIAQLHEAWDPARYGYLPHPEQRYQRWLTARAGDANSVFLVADRGGGTLAGFLIGTVDQNIPIYRVARFGFVHDLWVEPNYRHEGIGRQLVLLAVERFTQIGVPQVRLETAAENDAARKLFEQCGFRTASVEMLAELHDRERNAVWQSGPLSEGERET